MLAEFRSFFGHPFTVTPVFEEFTFRVRCFVSLMAIKAMIRVGANVASGPVQRSTAFCVRVMVLDSVGTVTSVTPGVGAIALWGRVPPSLAVGASRRCLLLAVHVRIARDIANFEAGVEE